MSNTKVLIDTNILIALEDPGETQPIAAEFARRCLKSRISLYVHPATSNDFARDTNLSRQTISNSRMSKYLELENIPLPNRVELEQKFGRVKSDNDAVDVALIHALDCDVVDLLISQDAGIHTRVKTSKLAERVLTLADAVSWLRSLQESVDEGIPFVTSIKAYSLLKSDPIFGGLREDYGGFDTWWRDKCCAEHRDCWVIRASDGSIGGLVVRKTEAGSDIGLDAHLNILKLCTFKVAEHAQGNKIGELLLKKALWYAQKNSVDGIYLTTFDRQSILIGLLTHYGFTEIGKNARGEIILFKKIERSELRNLSGQDPVAFARQNYPRFCIDEPANCFAIPVQWQYHRQLFPEIAYLTPLPLFNDKSLASFDDTNASGNTIRKVYVCRSKITTMKGGDIAFFYQSKDKAARHSQSVTTLGVVEKVGRAANERELTRMTAGRSVYSESDLTQLATISTNGILVIDFLLIGHLSPPAPLEDLVRKGVFNGFPPQSITQVPRNAIEIMKPSMHFGFSI